MLLMLFVLLALFGFGGVETYFFDIIGSPRLMMGYFHSTTTTTTTTVVAVG